MCCSVPVQGLPVDADTDADDYVVVQGWSGDGDGETSSLDFMSLPPHIRLALFSCFCNLISCGTERFLFAHIKHLT